MRMGAIDRPKKRSRRYAARLRRDGITARLSRSFNFLTFGVYAIMKLRLLAWSRLMSPNAIEHGLLLPVLFHCVDSAGRPVLDEQRRGPGTPSFAQQAWRGIPAVVEAIRQFWMPTRFKRGA